MLQYQREMKMYIPHFFCHLLQTYKFKCISTAKNSKEEIMWTALWLEELFHMTWLVLIKGRYKEPISHMPPARFTSHHEWERAREREKDPFSFTPDLISMPVHLLRPLAAVSQRDMPSWPLWCVLVNDTWISKKVKTGTTSLDPIVSNSVSDRLQSSQVQEQMGFCTLFGALWFLRCRWNCGAQS